MNKGYKDDKFQGLKTKSICHITSVHTRYDIRIFVKECISLVQNDFSVSLIVADSRGDESKDGINIFDVSKPSGRLKRVLITSRRIYKKLLELKPDVIHFHDPELMLIGVKLAKKGYKVIYDVHEDLPKQVLNKAWIPSFMRHFISKAVTQLEKKCCTKLSGIVAATPIIAKRFSKYNNNVTVVCNYPLLKELANISINWSDREDSLCYIGSISKTRGIEPLVRSLEISKLKLELAGMFSGDMSLSTIHQLPGHEYVNYNEVLNRKEIVGLLSKVKIGVVTLLPTPSYVESLPIKLFEYMLAGIPVVASDFKLWHDIIPFHKCGVLVDPNDPMEVATACNMLLNNQELAQQMGENGKKAVLEHYNWEVQSKHLVNFYDKLFQA